MPVLIQATPDIAGKMTIRDRRDSFCGKMSACNNLQAVRHPLLADHAAHRSSGLAEFRQDLEWFAGVCRVVNGLRRLRIGAIGARPAAFNTVRYSEKLLEASGITVETVDLSEILGRIGRMKDDDRPRRRSSTASSSTSPPSGIPAEALMKMAKLGAGDRRLDEARPRSPSAPCSAGPRMEEFFGVVPCTVMSMMSNDLMPSACEVDICRRGRHARAAARVRDARAPCSTGTTTTATIPNKAVCFHCSNLPKHFFEDVRMDFQEIIAGTVGKLNTSAPASAG